MHIQARMCLCIAACVADGTVSSGTPFACSPAHVLQERPEDIPTGELPRTLLMVVDRHLVGRVTPGSRLVVTGIYCTHRWGGAGGGGAGLH